MLFEAPVATRLWDVSAEADWRGVSPVTCTWWSAVEIGCKQIHVQMMAFPRCGLRRTHEVWDAAVDGGREGGLTGAGQLVPDLLAEELLIHVGVPSQIAGSPLS